MENEFLELIKPIIETENYQKMKNYFHHDTTSTYEHSISVAYLCYKYHKKHNSKIDLYSLIRGALLHDYYLYDWHHKNEGHRLHGLRHPKTSYKNAIRDYGPLNKIEKDMILHHMFPLIIIPPFTKAGWILVYYDKVATYSDYKKSRKEKKNDIK